MLLGEFLVGHLPPETYFAPLPGHSAAYTFALHLFSVRFIPSYLAFDSASTSAHNNHSHINCSKQLPWKDTFSSLPSVKKDCFPHSVSNKAIHTLHSDFCPQRELRAGSKSGQRTNEKKDWKPAHSCPVLTLVERVPWPPHQTVLNYDKLNKESIYLVNQTVTFKINGKFSEVFSKLCNFLKFSLFPCYVLDPDSHLTFFSMIAKPLRVNLGTSNVPVPTQYKTAFPLAVTVASQGPAR